MAQSHKAGNKYEYNNLLKVFYYFLKKWKILFACSMHVKLQYSKYSTSDFQNQFWEDLVCNNNSFSKVNITTDAECCQKLCSKNDIRF